MQAELTTYRARLTTGNYHILFVFLFDQLYQHQLVLSNFAHPPRVLFKWTWHHALLSCRRSGVDSRHFRLVLVTCRVTFLARTTPATKRGTCYENFLNFPGWNPVKPPGILIYEILFHRHLHFFIWPFFLCGIFFYFTVLTRSLFTSYGYGTHFFGAISLSWFRALAKRCAQLEPNYPAKLLTWSKLGIVCPPTWLESWMELKLEQAYTFGQANSWLPQRILLLWKRMVSRMAKDDNKFRKDSRICSNCSGAAIPRKTRKCQADDWHKRDKWGIEWILNPFTLEHK